MVLTRCVEQWDLQLHFLRSGYHWGLGPFNPLGFVSG